jgi:hypothetical protein
MRAAINSIVEIAAESVADAEIEILSLLNRTILP